MYFLNKDYFEEYAKSLTAELEKDFERLEKPQNGGFDFLLEAGAVYSSQIEGNTMDLNSFMNNKALSGAKPKEFQEIADLKEAYDFARSNPLDESNFLKVHEILSRLFVSGGNQGVYRQDKVGVFSSSGLVYMAVEYTKVAEEMQKLFADIRECKNISLTVSECMYFASLVHLRCAEIHPFTDGNGRAARLLEKWVLSEMLGEKSWLVQSEKYYWEHRAEYYANINLGINYYELDYTRCVPFLLMLPAAVASNA